MDTSTDECSIVWAGGIEKRPAQIKKEHNYLMRLCRCNTPRFMHLNDKCLYSSARFVGDITYLVPLFEPVSPGPLYVSFHEQNQYDERFTYRHVITLDIDYICEQLHRYVHKK